MKYKNTKNPNVISISENVLKMSLTFNTVIHLPSVWFNFIENTPTPI